MSADVDPITWLERRLQQERDDVMRTLELAHKTLLQDVRQHFPLPDGEMASISQPNNAQLSDTGTSIVPGPVRSSVSQSKLDAVSSAPSKLQIQCQEVESSINSYVERWDRTRFIRLIKSDAFEVMCGVVIVVNICWIAVRLQHTGMVMGHKLKYSGYDSPEGLAPHADEFFNIIAVVFNAWFVIEIFLRLLAYNLQAMHSYWFWFDVLIVTIGWLDLLLLSEHIINPTMIRALRLFKVVRVLKALHHIKKLEALFLLLKSISASLAAMGWSAIVLLLFQGACGLFLSQVMFFYLQDGAPEDARTEQLFKYFGTFVNTMVTMFEITFSNWVPVARFLYEDVGAAYGVGVVFYRCMVCLAVVGTITSLFIFETTRIAAGDDELMMVKKRRSKEVALANLKKDLWAEGVGHTMTKDEFLAGMKDETVQIWLNKHGYDMHDLMFLFDLLDQDNRHEIQAGMFMEGMIHLKATAMAVDVFRLQVDVKNIMRALDNETRLLAHISEEVSKFGRIKMQI